jgi:preprotein translocase subunit SecB
MTDEQFSKELDVQRIVVKDMSLETPMGQNVYSFAWKPVYVWSMEQHHACLADKLWEVVLSMTVTAKLGTNIAFLIEVQQAGVIKVADLDADSLDRVLAIEAPKLIFPYLRETVDNVAVKGGFSPVCLRVPDFDAIYENAKSTGTLSDGEQ